MASKKQAAAKTPMSTNNYIVVAALVSLLVVIISGFILNKLVRTVIVDTKVIAGKNKADHDLQTKLNNAPVLIDNYKKLGTKQQLIMDGLPTSEDFPQLVTIMESMAADSGLTLKSVGPQETTGAVAPTSAPASASSASAGGAPQPYQFTATVEGSYPKITQLLKDIELSTRPLRVVSAQMTGDSNDITANLQIATYFQPKADISDKKEPVQ